MLLAQLLSGHLGDENLVLRSPVFGAFLSRAPLVFVSTISRTMPARAAPTLVRVAGSGTHHVSRTRTVEHLSSSNSRHRKSELDRISYCVAPPGSLARCSRGNAVVMRLAGASNTPQRVGSHLPASSKSQVCRSDGKCSARSANASARSGDAQGGKPRGRPPLATAEADPS